MTMADVECAFCGHKMSKHEVVNRENAVCSETDCDCMLGPARRDDLLGEIECLEKERDTAYDKGKHDAVQAIIDAHEQTTSVIEHTECPSEEELATMPDQPVCGICKDKKRVLTFDAFRCGEYWRPCHCTKKDKLK